MIGTSFAYSIERGEIPLCRIPQTMAHDPFNGILFNQLLGGKQR